MDSSSSHDTAPNTLSSLSISTRKRSRENETTSQRNKREKAAERQRRKRERDRNNASNLSHVMLAFAQQPQEPPQQHQPQLSQQAPPSFTGQELTPDELARRERVRSAARDRQRKHRQIVKQKKMRDLGLEMGPEILQGMEGVYHRVNGDGQYLAPVMAQELPPPHVMNPQEPPFPHGQPLGGQTFASALLLSLSYSPPLRQHLVRSLAMTDEELASLEPVIAEAWDHWDHQRRLHYAQQAANAATAAENGLAGPSAPPPFPAVDMSDPAAAAAYAADPSQPHPNEFRARFHRPLVAPSPFRSFGAEAQAAAASTSTSTSGSGPSDPIDPHLTTTESHPQASSTLNPSSDKSDGRLKG